MLEFSRTTPAFGIRCDSRSLDLRHEREHLISVYPVPDRNVVADGRHSFVGLVAYPLLPVAPLPQVDFPTIQVSASLPGGSPETMASSVAQPLERQFAQIPGIAQMTSTSSLGSTSVTIQFDLDRKIDAAAGDVQAAINAASGQLPKNLPSQPIYRKVNPADSPIMILSATSDTLPLTTVSDRTDAQLAQQISQISGVAQVFVGGQQKPSIRVQIDPAKLVAKGLSLEDVRSQISIATTDNPKGNIDGERRAFTIYANDQLTSRMTGTTSSSPIAMAGLCGFATSAGRWKGRRT